jgi:outer membrane protein TolC
MRRLPFLILLLPAILAAQAPTPEPPPALTLEEAIQAALEHNHLLKAGQARLEGAAARVEEAESYRFPSLDAFTGFVRTDQPASAFALDLNQKRFSLQEMMTGDPNNPGFLDTFLSSVSLTMPIWTGGQISGAVRAARAAESAESLGLQRKRQETVRQVTRAYQGVLLAKEFAALMEKARATVERHVRMARDYYEAGMLVESEVLRAQVELAKMDDRLIQARNQEKTARLGLSILMGTDLDPAAVLTPAADALELPATDPAADLESALAARPDLLALESAIAALKADEERLRGQHMPTVGLSITQEWYDDTVFGTRGDAATGAVGIRIPIFWGGRVTAQTTQAAARVREMESMRSAMLEGVRLEVETSRYGMEEARARLEAARGNEAAAEKALSITEERYKKGILKMTDLLDADTALTEARTRHLQARYDLLLAHQDYSLALGKEL